MYSASDNAGKGSSFLARRFFDGVLEPIYRDWFRTQVLGPENIPASGPALIVGNHAGAFAIDALMVVHALERNSSRALHLLGASFFSKSPCGN